MERLTLCKSQRISRKHLIEQLFGAKNASATAYPLRAVWLTVDREEGDADIQILVSVSKRRFKHAVKRNRVKRQLREAYRLHPEWRPSVAEGKQLLIAFIWLADRLYDSDYVAKGVEKAMRKVVKDVNSAK